jgi:hypothetical protein
MQVLEPIGRHALNVRATFNDRRQQTFEFTYRTMSRRPNPVCR